MQDAIGGKGVIRVDEVKKLNRCKKLHDWIGMHILHRYKLIIESRKIQYAKTHQRSSDLFSGEGGLEALVIYYER